MFYVPVGRWSTEIPVILYDDAVASTDCPSRRRSCWVAERRAVFVLVNLGLGSSADFQAQTKRPFHAEQELQESKAFATDK